MNPDKSWQIEKTSSLVHVDTHLSPAIVNTVIRVILLDHLQRWHLWVEVCIDYIQEDNAISDAELAHKLLIVENGNNSVVSYVGNQEA